MHVSFALSLLPHHNLGWLLRFLVREKNRKWVRLTENVCCIVGSHAMHVQSLRYFDAIRSHLATFVTLYMRGAYLQHKELAESTPTWYSYDVYAN